MEIKQLIKQKNCPDCGNKKMGFMLIQKSKQKGLPKKISTLYICYKHDRFDRGIWAFGEKTIYNWNAYLEVWEVYLDLTEEKVTFT